MSKPTGKLAFAYQSIAALEQKLAHASAELSALKAGQGEAVGTLHISHFRQNPAMENVDFQMTADLPPGYYRLYTSMPASADVVSVPTGLLRVVCSGGNEAWQALEELRALLAQTQGVKP